jgi:hypothetical protein
MVLSKVVPASSPGKSGRAYYSFISFIVPLLSSARCFSTQQPISRAAMMSNLEADAAAYNNHVSMAVDLSNAHISDKGLLTGV